MIIALPTQDGETVSGHFGRSPMFAIYHMENGEIKSKELRKNSGAHGQGECSHGAHEHGTGHHSHAPMLSALSDVEVVITGGMGKKAYDDLVEAGKIVLMTDETNCDAAVKGFTSGTLSKGQQNFCGCNH